MKALAASLILAFATNTYALPVNGVVAAGGASIASSAGSMTVNQSTQNVAINWQSFSIGTTEAVRFVQPNSSSVALNRVLGSDPSSILGSLSANGKVFLVNPNGILFAQGAQVNVGGLIASTRNINDSDFMAGNYRFAGTGNGAILNQGTINAEGGYVALLGANVSNEGVISARLGNVTLAAGNAMTLDVAGDGLLNVAVNEGAVNALVQNGGMIRADGGQVLLTALSAGNLLQSAVNNTGVIQAQTAENHNGTIRLMGDMQSGTVNVGGTLDASAPNGGDGGFIETSAANVKFLDGFNITTVAPMGQTGTFLIDPQDFNVGGLVSDISGLALSGLLVNNSVIISTVPGFTAFVDTQPPAVPPPVINQAPGATVGLGDININETIPGWVAAGGAISPTTLTLRALNDVNVGVGATITAASLGNVVVCCGRDINVRGTITTTNGSILLSAARDVTLFAGGTLTTVDGNLTICAGRDITNLGTMSVTRGSTTAGQSLGLIQGLVLSAGNAATGPGPAGGTVSLAGGTTTVVTADTFITYNPATYTIPTNFAISVTGNAPTQFMLVFPDVVPKVADGTTTATLAGFKTTGISGPIPVGVTLTPGAFATANFVDATAGTGKLITYSDFSVAQPAPVAGPAGINFALPRACCGPAIGTTTGDIVAAAVPPGGGGGPVPVAETLPPVVLPVFYPYTTLAGLDLAVAGLRMPAIMVVEAPPVETGAVAIVPEEEAPVIMPPVLPRRPDRN